MIAAMLLAAALASAPPPPPTADSGRPIVIGRSYTLASRVLGDVRRINVYLPKGYDDAKRRFPVLYLLDGGEGEDFHHITGLAQVVAFSGRTQELIVVGIEGVDRRHDLTAPSHDPRDIKDVPTAGGADAYRRFLVQEVKPWVEARYRTAGGGALIGESLAGLFTAETFLRAPASFDDYVAISPSVWWDEEALAKEAAADLARPGFAGKRLYLTVGDEGPEMKDGVERIVSALKAKTPGAPVWRYDPRPDETHDSIYQPGARAALRWLYPVAPQKPAP